MNNHEDSCIQSQRRPRNKIWRDPTMVCYSSLSVDFNIYIYIYNIQIYVLYMEKIVQHTHT